MSLNPNQQVIQSVLGGCVNALQQALAAAQNLQSNLSSAVEPHILIIADAAVAHLESDLAAASAALDSINDLARVD